MTQKSKLIVGVAAFVLVLTGASLAYNALQASPSVELAQSEDGADPSSDAENEKMKAPDFTVIQADGTGVTLSGMEGKPVVLNFWASWCPPCKAEMPDFDKVYVELGGEVIFMMVNMTDGQRETVDIALAYVTEQGFSFPVYFDTEQQAARTYGVRSIPTTLFIDKDGYIVTGAQGQLDKKTLRTGIRLIQETEST